MDRFKVAVLIPAYNEEKTISGIVETVNKYGQPIVIDDGSNDKTGEQAKKSGAIVETHITNLGYDAALNTGFKKIKECNYDFVITLDADGQHEPELLKKFIEELNSGVSLVLGVRNKKARIAEYIFGFYTRMRFGIEDPLCGLKAYKIESYKSVGYFDSYKSIGTELMFQNIFLGKEYRQVYFNIKNRSGSTRFGNTLLGNLRILRSFLFFVFKRYGDVKKK